MERKSGRERKTTARLGAGVLILGLFAAVAFAAPATASVSFGIHLGHHYGHYRYYPRYYYRPYPYLHFYSPYYYHYRPYAYGYAGYDYPARGPMGALDLNVKPKKTEVYLDGQYIGVSGDYDGFPRYLWLEKGTYELVFFRQGYETVAREYTVFPGVVIDVKLRLRPGESQPPEAVSTVEPGSRGLGAGSAVERPELRGEPAYGPSAAAGEQAGPSLDVRDEPGLLRLEIEPNDASVYLDGRFLGTASELARLHAGLIVGVGEHVLEVVRPGHESERLDLFVQAGEELDLEVRLEAE